MLMQDDPWSLYTTIYLQNREIDSLQKQGE